MDTKIKAKYDFGGKEPYLKIWLNEELNDFDSDERDEIMRKFVEIGTDLPVVLIKSAMNIVELRAIGINSPIDRQELLIYFFNRYAMDLIDKTYPYGENAPRDLFAQFFNLLNDCIRHSELGSCRAPEINIIYEKS